MLKSAARVLVPAEFGDHGIKGMILAANYVPYLGIFLGMQISVIDFARSVLDGSDDMLVRHLIREEVLKWQRKGDVLSGNQPDRPVHLGVLQEWFGIHWGNTRAFALLFTLIFISLPLVLFRRVESLRFSSAVSVLLALVFVGICSGMAISALLEGKTNTPKLIPQLDNRASFFNLFVSSPVTVTAFTFHFNDYDFVITTYSIVEAEYRKNVMPAKYKCIWCGKLLFYEHKISIHLKYFGGPNAVRTNKQSKQKKGKKWDRIILEEVSREHKGKIYEVIDEARAFVEVLCDATNFASADTIYGFAAYPSGENCLGNAALVS
ncbi:hypothetical protein AgCh_030323 [Apium graveolens]